MGSVPPNLAVFVGPGVAGSHRWYWADASINPRRKVIIAGPFETKEKAVQNAAEMLTARPTPNAELSKHRPNSLCSSGVRMPRPGQPRAKNNSETLGLLGEGKGGVQHSSSNEKARNRQRG